jgi:hypothetical protein
MPGIIRPHVRQAAFTRGFTGRNPARGHEQRPLAREQGDPVRPDVPVRKPAFAQQGVFEICQPGELGLQRSKSGFAQELK